MSCLDKLDAQAAETIRDVLRRSAPELLRAVESTETPTMAVCEQVEDALAREFTSKEGLGPDWEPTPWGKRIDDAIGAFLMRFPIERR